MVLVSPEDVTINGVNLSSHFNNNGGYFIVNEVIGRHIPQRNLNLVTAQGQDGAHYLGSTLETRPLRIFYTLKGSSFQDLRRRLEELNKIIIIKETIEIVFADEPDRIYYGVVNGGTETRETSMIHQGVIDIIRPDPFKYGAEKRMDFVEGAAFVENEGTFYTYPSFRVEVLENISYLDIYNEIDFMRIGQTTNDESTPINRQILVLLDDMEDTLLWSASGTTEGGTVAGAIRSNGFSFMPSDFGAASTSWHGPAVQRSIPQAPLENFMVEARIIFNNPRPTSFGRLVIELLDDRGEIIARMNMNKRTIGSEGNEGVIRAGNVTNGQKLIETKGNKGIEWRNFNGVMRIKKSGQHWSGYISQINYEQNKHYARAVGEYFDAMNELNRPLAQLRVAFATRGDNETAPMYVQDIKVYDINTEASDQPEVIASAGDLIEIDHENDLITVNGEARSDLKDFAATFYPLKTGLNTLFIEPSGSVQGQVRWKERFL